MNKSFISKYIYQQLLLVGILFLVCSQLFEYSIWKLNIDELVASVGALLLVTASIQWLIDTYLLKEFFDKITDKTIANINIASCGLINIYSNSKEIDYSESILFSSELIIGFNYSPGLLDRYYDEFKERANKKLKTTLIVLDETSNAANYIKSDLNEDSYIDTNLAKLKSMVNALNNINPKVMVMKKHKTVLRYSFVCADTVMWIKPYRNSIGKTSRIPALQFKSSTDMYDYFNADIRDLIAEGTA